MEGKLISFSSIFELLRGLLLNNHVPSHLFFFFFERVPSHQLIIKILDRILGYMLYKFPLTKSNLDISKEKTIYCIPKLKTRLKLLI